MGLHDLRPPYLPFLWVVSRDATGDSATGRICHAREVGCVNGRAPCPARARTCARDCPPPWGVTPVHGCRAERECASALGRLANNEPTNWRAASPLAEAVVRSSSRTTGSSGGQSPTRPGRRVDERLSTAGPGCTPPRGAPSPPSPLTRIHRTVDAGERSDGRLTPAQWV